MLSLGGGEIGIQKCLLPRVTYFIAPADNCLVKILNLNEPVGPQECPIFFADFVQAFPDNFPERRIVRAGFFGIVTCNWLLVIWNCYFK